MMTISEAIEEQQRVYEWLLSALDRLEKLSKDDRVPKAKVHELVSEARQIAKMSAEIGKAIEEAMAIAEGGSDAR